MLGLNADAVLHSPATQEHPPSSAEPLTGVRALVVGAAVASALLVWAVTSLLHDTGVSVPESPGSDQRPAVETSTVARDVGRRRGTGRLGAARGARTDHPSNAGWASRSPSSC